MTGRIKRDELAEKSYKLPVIGKIKIGEKQKVLSKTTGKPVEIPVSLDYFKADTKSKYALLFHQIYGEKPNKIQVIFTSDNVEDVCNESYVIRNGEGRLLAEGDGETWRIWNESAKRYEFTKGNLSDIEKKYGKASVTLRLRFLLPAIKGVFGVWQLTTKGVNSSIPEITDTFDAVMQRAGHIVNIPFDLVVEKTKSQKPGVASVYPVLTLIPNISQENMMLLKEYSESGKDDIFTKNILTDAKIDELFGGEKKALPEHKEETIPEQKENKDQTSLEEAAQTISQQKPNEIQTEEREDWDKVTGAEADEVDYEEVVEEAEEIIPEVSVEIPTEEPKPEPEPPKKPTRPLSPMELKKYMHTISVNKPKGAESKLIKKAKDCIGELTNHNEEKRDMLLKYIYDSGITGLTEGECEAIIRWVNLSEVDEGSQHKVLLPNGMAIKEADRIYNEVYKLSSNQELF